MRDQVCSYDLAPSVSVQTRMIFTFICIELICGMLYTAVFAVGNLIYVSLELEYALSDPPEGCKKQTYGWVYVFRFIFVLVQTFLLLKNSSVSVALQNILKPIFKHVEMFCFGEKFSQNFHII